MIITIDGPSGTGKSSVATRLAKRLGFSCFDTGAMYRAFTVYILDSEIELHDKEPLKKKLEGFQFRIEESGGCKRYFIGKQDVTEEIRTPRVTANVSRVAAIKEVRERLVDFQKQFATQCNAVFEGRDMGTVVFPHADLKIFLTASPEARADRRFLEWEAKGKLEHTKEEVLKQILERDHMDSSRPISPLKKAEDGIEIDTTHLTLDEVVNRVETLWKEKVSC